jgi:hypothetical protein
LKVLAFLSFQISQVIIKVREPIAFRFGEGEPVIQSHQFSSNIYSCPILNINRKNPEQLIDKVLYYNGIAAMREQVSRRLCGSFAFFRYGSLAPACASIDAHSH